jgi:bla regulator protein BlaR1
MSGALLDHLWQSTLFGAAAWSIALALRSNSAAIRHWIWLLASVKFLVPFSALYMLGAAAGLPTPVESQPDFFGTALAAATPVMWPTLTLGASQPGLPSLFAPALLMIWAVVATGLALHWLRCWRAADLLSRAARPAPGALPDARVTDVDIEPSVARVFDPVVLLPSALLGRLSATQLDAVMAHEREHIARHDNLKAHVHRLVEILFWFHPLVWFIGRQLREERELACDEAVLERGHDPAEYAAGILEVCRHCATVHSKHAVAALAGDLTQRIRQILNGASPVSLGFIKAFVLTVSVLLVAAGPLLAGAVDDAVRRHAQVEVNARALRGADIGVNPAASSAREAQQAHIIATGNEVVIRNASLRELIALVYGVDEHEISGGSGMLDDARYEIRARVPGGLSDPERFEPAALREAVTKLLAVRFNLELHVNRLCQSPCGPRALNN